MSRTICWFSSGAASAVMAKLVLAEIPEAMVVQCGLGDSEDADNARFAGDCERWFGKPITYEWIFCGINWKIGKWVR